MSGAVKFRVSCLLGVGDLMFVDVATVAAFSIRAALTTEHWWTMREFCPTVARMATVDEQGLPTQSGAGLKRVGD